MSSHQARLDIARTVFRNREEFTFTLIGGQTFLNINDFRGGGTSYARHVKSRNGKIKKTFPDMSLQHLRHFPQLAPTRSFITVHTVSTNFIKKFVRLRC